MSATTLSAGLEPLSGPPRATAEAGSGRLFRRIDWLTFALATLAVGLGYYLTLAPEVTLEDSGELATASFYAGVPHSPGYPVWTIYTWFWTVLVPFGSVAWRVALGEATAGALACGLIGLVVSRGSGLILDGIEAFRELDRRRVDLICLVSGFVAALLLGYDGFMWGQSVIVEVYAFSVLSLMGVMTCLLRWAWVPQQRRYLYWAFFLFGICFTNHQTLLLAAMGLEIAVLAIDAKLGRDLFLGNGIVYLAGLVWKLNGGLTNFEDNQSLFNIYHFVGIGSLYLFLWYSLKIRRPVKLASLGVHTLINIVILAIWMNTRANPNPVISDDLSCWLMIVVNPIGIGLIYLGCLIADKAERAFTEFRACGYLLLLWLAGAGFYFYMPIASMTNPPMNWSYTRTVSGFFHAVSRGQYERTVPSDLFTHPFRFVTQLQILVSGISDEFNWAYALIAPVPLLFLRRMQKRERGWLIGVTAIYLCLGVFLTIMLNPNLDRESRDVVRVFYTASHVMVAILIGYGLALIAATLLAERQRACRWLPAAAVLLLAATAVTFAGAVLEASGATVSLGGVASLAWGVAFAVLAILILRTREAGGVAWLVVGAVGGTAAVTFIGSGIMDVASGNPNLSELSRALGNGIIHWCRHGDPTLAICGAGLVAVVVLLGLAACARRQVHFGWLMTAFALMPLYSVLSHWFDNEQRGHLFGYWYGHDMFTPPQSPEVATRHPGTTLDYPQMPPGAILFGGTDPGRFCPTYMIFCESQVSGRCKPLDPTFDRRDVYIITQNSLADSTYLDYIRAQYFRSEQKDPPFFQELLGGNGDSTNHPGTNFIARMAGVFLDRPLEAIGQSVEARRRREGIFPEHEIHTPLPADFDRCYHAYADDAERRWKHDRDFPDEPPQVRPGEEFSMLNHQFRIDGDTAVFALNGALAKIIFDRNPDHEFFLEESLPIDWMYPYLTPYGIIMKLNRQPVAELTDDIVRRDHEFWSHYSERLIGNWITYDTTASNVVDFVDKVYVRHELDGFNGDRKFVRDDVAQKSFSKLRSSIAGLYYWRVYNNTNQSPTVRQRMMTEADFAFRQAFAFGPFNAGTAVGYANLLIATGRLEDALLVAKTSSRLDPNNIPLAGMATELERFNQLMTEVQANPTDYQKALELASVCLDFQRVTAAELILDGILGDRNAPATAVSEAARLSYEKLHDPARVERAFERLAQLEPDRPEVWCNLADLKVAAGKTNEALDAVRHALDSNARRLAAQPGATDVRNVLATDSRLAPLHNTPEWQALFPGK